MRVQVGVDTGFFQLLERRLPVDAGAFHRGGGDAVSSSRLVLAGRGIISTSSRCDAGFHHGLLSPFVLWNTAHSIIC